MKKLLILLLVTCYTAIPASAEMKVHPALEILSPYVGKTWEHTTGSPGEKGYFHDISTWEWIMGGHGILTNHSVNKGAYGGTSIFHYDEKAKSLICYYATTGGFYTTCTIKMGEDGIEVWEDVKGSDKGPSAVKSTITLEDGKMIIRSSYKTGDTWVDGGERIYTENADAVVSFQNK